MSYPKNIDWNLVKNSEGYYLWEQVQVAVLMDIREELRVLNRILSCNNFLEIPYTLKGIQKNTARPKRKAVKR